MPSLSGKVAIVTGSSRGIGRGIAERLGRDGASVVVTYAGSRDKAEEVVQAIASTRSKVTAIQVDVRKLEDVQTLLEKARCLYVESELEYSSGNQVNLCAAETAKV